MRPTTIAAPLVLLAALAPLASQASAAADPPTPEGIAFFESKIRPLLAEQCYSCHANSATRVRGGLKLDSLASIMSGGDNGAVVVPGDPEHSPLIIAVRYNDDSLQMPPKKRLPDESIKLLEQWVKMGAPHPDGAVTPATVPPQKSVDMAKGREHWAYKPRQQVDLPSVNDSRWSTNGVDLFVLAGLEAHGLKPTPDADRHTWLRRVTFDLTGLAPTQAEMDAFDKDRSATAYETVVDRLLASPQYGERWGRHWLDVARYAESSGKENNTAYPFAWRYRDYVISAFNKDKPFDQFLKEQLAGDLLPAKDADDRAENLIATGYLAIGPKSHATRGQAQFKMDVADEQIDAFSQGMMGMTLACARCHDHKFDPIPQKDYYAVAGIFLSTDTEYGTYRGPGNLHPGTLLDLPADARSVPNGPDMPGVVRAAYERQRGVAEKDSAEFDQLRQAQRPGTMQRNADGMPTKAPAVDQVKLQRLRFAKSQLEMVTDVLARYDEQGHATAANRLAMGVQDRSKPTDARLLVRGELEKPSDVVPRGFAQIITPEGGPTIKQGSGRKELAEWVASDSNPLTARVWANRVWLHLFGKGIVPTPDNFGMSGVPPTHPELLDWLANQLVANHWSTKALIRELVLSHTYRMGSQPNAKAMEKDPDNVWLWRMPKKRLEAESIRDAMLQAAGTLDLKPPVGSPVAFLEGQDRNPLVARMATMEQPVRSVYLPVMRDHLPEMLDVFDMAEPAYVSGEREKTSVPTQALFMMNDTAVLDAAGKMADRLLAMKGSDTDRVRAAFAWCFGRVPSQSEMTAVKGFFRDFPAAQNAKDVTTTQKQGWTAFCQALFQSAEFRTLD